MQVPTNYVIQPSLIILYVPRRVPERLVITLIQTELLVRIPIDKT